ncbi:MAG: hypothetical protein ACWA5A_17490 [Marinibacterium sp.]
MFEFLKTTLHRLLDVLADTVHRLTGHRACYAYVAMSYSGGVLHVLDKDTVSQLVIAIYFILAVRG